jgi:branched-chain amino acid transport system substrate-binding protein
MGDLTGQNANIVIPPRNGAQLAVDQYNATNPKHKIKLIPYDSQGDATQATNLATKAVTTDKIQALVGPAFSGESKSVDPILEQAKVPSISPSATNATLAQHGWKYWHRDVANDDVQGPGAAKFAVSGLKSQAAFVIDDKSAYGQPLAAAVNKTLASGGVKVVGTDSIDPNASDYSTTVNKVKAANPDYIFFGGYYAAAGKLLKQLREGGVKTAAFQSGDGSYDKALISGAGVANATKTFASCPCLVPDAGTAQAGPLATFAAAYKAKYGADPQIYAAEGYDAAQTFVKAVAAGNTTGETINKFLGTVNFAGVSKQIQFDASGEPAVKSIYIYEATPAGIFSLLGASDTAQPK